MIRVTRETRETRIQLTLDPVPGAGAISTGDAFLDHMLVTLARCAGWTLTLEARGDLRHHLIEDVAIALGAAVLQATPTDATRYAERTVAMDDALVQAVLDAGGRAYYRGPLPGGLWDHWMRSFADAARLTLHVRVLRGRDRHHAIEAGFKALGMALRAALAPAGDVASTKGAVRLEVERC